LAGGSNNGIYKSIRDNHFALTMAIGMDADCSAHGKSIPFSVIIRTDKLIEDYLAMWVDGKELPSHSSYGLKDGYTDIVISPYFYDMNIQWKPYYEKENYWEDAYYKYKEEAIEKESEYEER
jgi:basic membrane lipoprotein Med (substrate-binding protein (PBP1-ABC) superfamily)